MALGGVAIERTAERRDCCGLACTLGSRSRLCLRHRGHRVATTEYSLVILERRPQGGDARQLEGRRGTVCGRLHGVLRAIRVAMVVSCWRLQPDNGSASQG